MYNAAQKIIDIGSRTQLPQEGQFILTAYRIECEHLFQFYVDYGATEYGPWAAIGIQDTEILVGYPPIPHQPKKAVNEANNDPAQG
jgi:hypothetical protein